MFVGRRMTRDPKTVGPDDPLTAAAGIMRESRFNHLPVVEGGRLVGIVSDTDLRNASLEAGEGSAAGRKVGEVMQAQVWSLTPEDSVEDALLVICRTRFGALPVLSGEKLVGIITKIDLLRAFADVLDLREVGVRVEVRLPRSLARFEELVGTVTDLGIDVRSCLITSEKGDGGRIVLLRLDTVDGPKVRKALREAKFDVLAPSDFL